MDNRVIKSILILSQNKDCGSTTSTKDGESPARVVGIRTDSHIQRKIRINLSSTLVIYIWVNIYLLVFLKRHVGFHIKIKHTGSLQLGAIDSQLKSIRPTPSSQVDYFVSRFSRRNAHVILVPATKDATESALNMLGRIVIFLKSRKLKIHNFL